MENTESLPSFSPTTLSLLPTTKKTALSKGKSKRRSSVSLLTKVRSPISRPSSQPPFGEHQWTTRVRKAKIPFGSEDLDV
jgi:hypothetical protein